ncbi:bifunctional sugar-1-phosphate nucleotidylyltransferase/acetyltransferase [Nanoarchaeota archaeon]
MTQAVILAAGKSTRTYPLTLTRPKPLLKIANKTILQHNIEQLVGLVNEVILVVGYKKEMIKKEIANIKKQLKLGKKIKFTFVNQTQQLGTGHALKSVKNKIKGKFLLIGGDDLFDKKDLAKCLKNNYAILAQKVKDPSQYGVLKVDKKNNVKQIVEKPKSKGKKKISKLANTGCYVFQKEVFDYEFKKSRRGEYELIDVINYIIKTKKVKCIKTENWIPVTYPWNLLDANERLLSKIKKTENKGRKEKGVVIKGKAIIGKGTKLKANVYIEGTVVIGENCDIGPNCYIRGSTSIGNNCKIGHQVEIKNSIIMDKTKVPHLTYLGDSVLGENINIGAGSMVANLRHDKGIIKSEVNGKLVKTGRKKLGVIIGDNVKAGIKTIFYPGRKIWPNKSTKPSQEVKKDIK